MGKRAFVLGVDLDGTCADFYGGLRPIAAEWLGRTVEDMPSDVSFGLDEWGLDPDRYERLHRFAVTQRDLFRTLQPMPGAPQALRRLSDHGIRIRIITHRLFIKYFHQVAIQQTVQWLDHHDIPYWDLCFLRDKSAVGADLYVEDAPEMVQRLRADGHPTLVFANSTNRHLDPPRAADWDEAAEQILDQLHRWHERHADQGALPGE